jgi:NAD(P)-dependent dehydrogenase (short-subunit alcohol dehydrogenase family)
VGAAVARAFAARGDRVVVHHSGERSRDVAEAVLGSLDGSGHARVAADVSDPSAVRVLADDAVAALGRVDVLVNNAAMMCHLDPVEAGAVTTRSTPPRTRTGCRCGSARSRPTSSGPRTSRGASPGT